MNVMNTYWRQHTIVLFHALGTAICASSSLATPPRVTSQRIKKIHEVLSQAQPPIAPEQFFGSSTSDHQVAGYNTNNTHYLFERANNPHYPHIKACAGRACDQAAHLDEDIAAMQDMGLAWYRFSIEWTKVQPREGVWDDAAIAYYRTVISKLKAAGIEPIVNLHHYTDPIWFALKGGFAKEENVALFACYAQKMAQELPEVTYWSTFNSPAGYTARMYMTASGPPTDLSMLPETTKKAYAYAEQSGNHEHAIELLLEAVRTYIPPKTNIPLTAQTLLHVMQAHVAAAQKLHETTHNKAKVGILQNIHQLDPWYQLDPLAQLASYINEELNHRSIHRAFTDEQFSVSIPIPWPGKYCNLYRNIPGARTSLDWIGLNYYSHRWMQGTQRVTIPQEPMTDNPNYSIYPEGIYRALHQLHTEVAQPLSIPVLITENGIATNDDTTREQFVLAYLEQITRAIDQGIPVKAWCQWSLLDNYEWGSPIGEKNYGLLAVDPETLERTPKPIVATMKRLTRSGDNTQNT